MKKTTLMLSMLLTIIFTYSQAPNTWTRKADFAGLQRSQAVGFSIGNKGYIGTGTGGFGQNGWIYFKDFWEYDPVTNAWTQKADFGGDKRQGAVGFNIGNKGYIGTGFNGISNTKDFWEYDPATNTWMKKTDFGGAERSNAVGFSISNKGYIGTGSGPGGFYKDFWEYNPATDTWTQKADLGGNPRLLAVGFSIGSKGYIGTGTGPGYLSDFWEYNPVSDKWQKKADYGGGPTQAAIGFSIDNKGYIGTGDGFLQKKDFWEYVQSTDQWIQKADFGGVARDVAVGFSINDKGYIGTGSGPGFTNDFWEYTPGGDTGCQAPVDLKVSFISDTSAVLKWTIAAIPVNAFDILYRMIGSTLVHKRHTTGSSDHIAIANLLPGTSYEWRIRSDCTADTTKWINGPDFITLSSTASVLNAKAKHLNLSGNTVQILPNPNNGNFVVQMQLPVKAASTTLTLYNNTGTRVWEQNAGMLSGFVSRNINLESKLSPGVYVLIVQNGDTQVMQKVVVSK